MNISLAISPVTLCYLQNIDIVLTTTVAYSNLSSPATESSAAIGLPSKMIVKWISSMAAMRQRAYRKHGLFTNDSDKNNKEWQ